MYFPVSLNVWFHLNLRCQQIKWRETQHLWCACLTLLCVYWRTCYSIKPKHNNTVRRGNVHLFWLSAPSCTCNTVHADIRTKVDWVDIYSSRQSVGSVNIGYLFTSAESSEGVGIVNEWEYALGVIFKLNLRGLEWASVCVLCTTWEIIDWFFRSKNIQNINITLQVQEGFDWELFFVGYRTL